MNTSGLQRACGLTRRDLLPVSMGVLALVLWSTYTYLTLRIDGDMVAEMIQVQQWMARPFFVLSYPGQLHGGVLEYPLLVLAETMAPGNPYGFTLIRVLYLPAIGLLTFVNVRRIFPTWSLWPMAIAMAIGPAVLHSMMMIKDLYPFSWLIATIGVTIALRQFEVGAHRGRMLVLAGVLMGLAFYEQPTSVLFSIPIVLTGIAHWRLPTRGSLQVLAGFLLGAIPLVMALTLQGGKRLVYMPAAIRTPDVAGAFGLVSDEAAWKQALVPNGWGIEYTDLNDFMFPPQAQVVLNSWLAGWLLVAVAIGAVGLFGLVRNRPVGPRTLVSVMWGSSTLLVVGLAVIVPPLYFYGAALAVLVWMTIAALPHLARGWLARTVTVVLLALMAVTSAGTFLNSEPKLKTAVWFKQQQVDEIRAVGEAIAKGGVHVIFGDYWEVLPIAYSSRGALHPLTTTANRFPLPTGLATGGEVDVAVPSGSTALPIGLGRWSMAQDAIDIVETHCRPRPDLTAKMPRGVRVFRCPVSVVDVEPTA